MLSIAFHYEFQTNLSEINKVHCRDVQTHIVDIYDIKLSLGSIEAETGAIWGLWSLARKAEITNLLLYRARGRDERR